MVTLDMVLVLLFAQVLFAYYYIAMRVAGITFARVW
jgi:hypothetical protein